MIVITACGAAVQLQLQHGYVLALHYDCQACVQTIWSHHIRRCMYLTSWPDAWLQRHATAQCCLVAWLCQCGTLCIFPKLLWPLKAPHHLVGSLKAKVLNSS